MSSPAFRTFLGRRVWPGTYLKLYFPFIISSSTVFFLFGNVVTKLTDAPDDKWVNLVENVEASGRRQKLKSEAEEYFKSLKQ